MAENISQNLSGRQREIFLAIYNAIAENGFPPTVRELGEIVGLNSPSSVKYQLDSLEEIGFIARDRRRPRTIEITTLGQEYLQHQIPPVDSTPTPRPAPAINSTSLADEYSEAVQVPLVGDIAAGSPILAEQRVEEFFSLPRQLTGKGELFMLKVHGESMVDAAICDGDWVVVRKQEVAENGEIVAALLEEEATVKVLKRQDGHTWLLPRNPEYAPIPGDDAKIMGKVVSVLRAL
ncbi:transcriptional repressor LexA [uncultured Arcanobacterium sp.]|uniref:transcriptional repressor LexA n=1 Tax=uncultured Arcanobacterium sp. TaxID=487520 RepID=UPI0026230C05|nr:transcriptional repressor LexA [uncultured Arcanobacterium sp.]